MENNFALDKEMDEHQKNSTKISLLRNQGDLSEAISICRDLTQKYPETYFYPKILGDLFFQQAEYTQAASAYLIFLKRIKDNRRLFSDFAKRYYKLRRLWPEKMIAEFAGQLAELVTENQVSAYLKNLILNLIKTDLKSNHTNTPQVQLLIELISKNGLFSQFTKIAKEIEEQNPTYLLDILDNQILTRKRTRESYAIDHHTVALFERMGSFEHALKVALELYPLKKDPVIVRTILRLCRKISDYASADALLTQYPGLLTAHDFNINYELVYYFEHKNDFEKLIRTLDIIEKRGKDSIPIQRTVKNFYLTYGLIDGVKRVDETLEKLFAKKNENYSRQNRFREEVKESENEMTSKIRELYSELEHNKQLAAISDLTNGISHELGQPITNIRFTVQYYKKILQEATAAADLKKTIAEVFDSILEETVRMGRLVKRLSPLTSGKNIIQEFELTALISQRLKAEKLKILQNDISVKFSSKPVLMTGDPVHFDQIISNLLLNAIDSIVERGTDSIPNEITISITQKGADIFIRFADTGIGIPIQKRGKIFDPFYTTKAPGQGEGLGLFIIWNLLTMHGGSIKIDSEYHKGACFIIKIPKHTKSTRG